MTYFELFDLTPAYKIDETNLKAAFLKLSRQYHPDRFVLKAEDEKTEAEDKSALINKAYQVLANEDSRLKYLLELHQVIQDEEVYTLNQDFLMDMLDINDLILENRDEAIQALSIKDKELKDEIVPVLDDYDFNSITTLDLKKIKEYHYKRRYLWRLSENIKGNMEL